MLGADSERGGWPHCSCEACSIMERRGGQTSNCDIETEETVVKRQRGIWLGISHLFGAVVILTSREAVLHAAKEGASQERERKSPVVHGPWSGNNHMFREQRWCSWYAK